MNYRSIWLLMFMTCWSISEKRMAIVIPSYNNQEWYQKNLDSVFSQNYENWHIIYIDDCSGDKTGELVLEYVKQKNMEHKVTVIINPHRKGALANHYRAVHMCDDWEIVCQLDGDDWFAHDDVLKRLNEIYEDKNIWTTYGSFMGWPTNAMGYSKQLAPEVVEKRLFRETYWTPGQLRTFYAWLFKKIKLEDLLWDHWDESYGRFYPAASDLAFSYPLMEMAGKHYKFIDEIIYIHNVATQINDFKVHRLPQIIASHTLLHKRKYEPLEKAPDQVKKAHRPEAKKVDVIIFSFDPAVSIDPLIESCRASMVGMHKLFSVDVATSSITEYDDVQGPITRKYETLKSLFLKELHNWWKSSEYVLFLDAHMKIAKDFNMVSYIELMEKTQGYAYFPALRVSTMMKNSPFTMLDDKICAWKLCYLERQWMRGPAYFNVLMHKKSIRDRITFLDDELIKNNLLKNVFEPGMLMIQDGTISRIGLCGVTQNLV